MENLKSMDKMLPFGKTSWIFGGASLISSFNVYLSFDRNEMKCLASGDITMLTFRVEFESSE